MPNYSFPLAFQANRIITNGLEEKWQYPPQTQNLLKIDSVPLYHVV